MLALLALFSQEANSSRRVVFVLDDSGSMTGEKYKVADYALQFLGSVLDDSDEFYIVRGNDLITIKHTHDDLRAIEAWQQKQCDGFSLLKTAIPAFKNDGKDNWLIIFSDGVWGDWNTYRGCKGGDVAKDFDKEYSAFYNSIRPNVVFIQTLRERSERASSSLESALLKDYKLVVTHTITNGDVEELSKDLSLVTQEILGTSQNRDFKKVGDQSIEYTPEIPLKGFIVYYEDEILYNTVPQVTDLKSTFPLVISEHFQNCNDATPPVGELIALISSFLYHVKPAGNGLIPAGKQIRINFDRRVNPSKIRILPFAELEFNVGFVGKFKSQDPENGVYEICEDLKEYEVVLEGKNLTGITDTNGLLKSLKVIVKSNDKSYEAGYSNGKLTCMVPVKADTSMLSIQIIKDGYLDKMLKTIVLIRKVCDISGKTDTVPGGQIQFPDIALSTFVDKICSEGFLYVRQTGQPLDPKDFDLVLFDAPMGTSFDVEVVGSGYRICLKKNLCNCFMREGTYAGKYRAKSKNPNYESIEGEWKINLKTDQPWYLRCLKLLLFILFLILFLLYIILLFKKPRFRRGSYIQTKRVSQFYEDERSINYGALRKLPTGIISRYLIPIIPERTTVGSLILEATRTSSIVLVKENCLSKSTMRRNGQRLEHYQNVEDKIPSKGEQIIDGDVITVTQNDYIDFYKITIP